MADATTVVEGKIKFREGKKWKPRWCVLKKPSPVADQLQAVLYKDVSESVKSEAKPKSVFALDAFFGLRTGFPYDREDHVMAVICQKNISLMAFELRENMIQFEIKIRQSLGEENQFPVKVVKAPSNSKLPKEQVCLMIHDMRFCLIAQSPPKILLSWNIEDLRKFGARDGKFCFEGGTRCGKGTGVFALQSDQAEDIADIVNLASTGKMSNCHRKFKNRRRISLSAKDETLDGLQYTTLTIPLDLTNKKETEMSTLNRKNTFAAASATLWCDKSEFERCTQDACECISPAKSILRPRSGQEYVVIKRTQVPTPTPSSASIPSQSPSLSKIFNFDIHPHEAHYHHHHHRSDHLHGDSSCTSLTHCSRTPAHTPQRSPSCSSTADTSRSHISLHNDNVDSARSLYHGRDGTSNVRPVAASPSPLQLSHPLLSQSSVSSASPIKDIRIRSGHADTTEESVFFPNDMLFSSSPPPSPFLRSGQPSPSPRVHCPIYVNQEFIDQHHNATSVSQTVSTGSSHSSASPIRAGVHSLMSLIFKDFPSKHSSSNESHKQSHRKSRRRSRNSESDAKQIEKHSLSLSLGRPSQNLSLPVSNIQRSHSDPKRTEKAERLPLSLAREHSIPSETDNRCKVHQKEYDKFAESAIISRRRLQSADSGLKMHSAEVAAPGSKHYKSSEAHSKESGLSLYIPAVKSSGYKNLDSFHAAVLAAVSTPSPKHPSLGPDSSHPGYFSQLQNISESQNSPDDHNTLPSKTTSHSPNSHTLPLSALSSTSDYSAVDKSPLPSQLSLPLTPAPPLPRRQHSPPSSPFTPSDISDSPPSYFAPSPPSTPPPPPLPPRKPLLPLPSPVPPSTPSEPDIHSEMSDEEQELNYIEIDMTKSPPEAPPLPRVTYVRRSKRVRQQKERDSAKLRYAIIDHRATKALQEARQEHVQAREGKSNQRRPAGHLSRMNSAPASSKRKQFSVVPRERKLSSGSVESC